MTTPLIYANGVPDEMQRNPTVIEVDFREDVAL
jgi:hypothetical protein